MIAGRALVVALALVVPSFAAPTPVAAQVTTTFLSDLQWTSAANGWGPVERDHSVGAGKAGDGGPIRLKNKTYAKGLGTHPRADISYALSRRYGRFLVDLGIDDECGGAGSVGFQIFLDGVKTYDKRVIGTNPTQVVSLDTTNKSTLRLVVTDGGDGLNCDHADWAGARLESGSVPPSTAPTTTVPASTTTTSSTTATTLPTATSSAPTPSTTYLSSMTPSPAVNGMGAVRRDTNNNNGPIKLRGKTYTRGLGVYPRSDLTYALGRAYTSFLAQVGIDDLCGGSGSVDFEVYRDGAKVYAKHVTGLSATQAVSIDTTTTDKLRLVVTDGGDGVQCEYADWADARVTSGGSPPSSTTSPTTTAPSTTSPPPTTSPASPGPFRFDDVTSSAGLGALSSAYVHAGAWGDVNGDGRPDLFVGTFTHEARDDGQTPSPSRLFLGTASGFQSAGQTTLEVSGTAAGAVLADLDNDGDSDLVVSNYRLDYPPTPPQLLEPHRLYRNDDGTFVDISQASGIRASEWNGRAVGLLDYDGDGRLDLYLVADSLLGSGTRVSRLFRNMGGLVFQDTTAAAGLPTNRSGLGIAVGDANGDTWPDLVATGGVTESGSYAQTYLFVNNRNGTFRDATTANLAWMPRTSDDWTAGAAWGDLNGDGRLDLVVGHHFATAANNPIAPRVYLNSGNDAASNPILEELTGAGLAPIAARAPHLEIQDFDNDGRPDIYTSVRLAGPGGLYIYRHAGTVGGRPSFTSPQSPTIPYYSPGGPTADYDRDGRLDVFLEGLNRFIPPTLLRNSTPGTGHWLDVKVRLGGNTNGIGARVKVYRAGGLGQAGALLGTTEITTGNGFSSAQLPVAHFGLGVETTVDVQVIPPFGGAVLTRTSVGADQTISVAP